MKLERLYESGRREVGNELQGAEARGTARRWLSKSVMWASGEQRRQNMLDDGMFAVQES